MINDKGEIRKMHKNFKIVFALLIAIFTLPLLGNTVLAETEDYDLEDGEYPIDIEALHVEKDQPSGAASFIGKKAILSIQNGKIELRVTIPNNEMAEITGLQVGQNDPTVEKADEANYYTYQLNELTTYLEAQVQYEVPSMGMNGDEPFRFHLKGLDELPVKEDKPDETIKPEEEDNNSEPDASESSIKLDEGYYTINASYLRNDNDNPSSMGSYLDNAAFISVKDGKVKVTITVADHETVTKLQINDKNAVAKKVNGNKRYETFVLDNLPSTLNAYVEYQAPYQGEVFKGKADFRISFDEGSLSKASASDQPGKEVSDEPKQDQDKDQDKEKNPEKPANQNDKSETNKNDANNKDKNNQVTTTKNNSGKNKSEQKNSLAPDEAYKIDYVVKHESEDKASAADSFFKKPAYLLYKNGEKYLQLTVTNSDMIDSLITPNGDVIIVKENADGSMVIQFKVTGDLSEAILLNMHITVPGMYSMEHSARLFLDPNSKKEIDTNKFLLVASKNGNGPTAEDGKTGKVLGDGDKDGISNKKSNEEPNKDSIATPNKNVTPEKPEFGSNNKTANTGKGENAQNPQTGDTSGILLYTLLLIGSLIPLAVKLKRRFV